MISQKEQKYIDRIAQLEQELSVLKKMIFGSKRERFIPDIVGQEKLFTDDQIGSEPVEEQPQQITHSKKQRRDIPKRKTLEVSMPKHLVRVEQIIEPKKSKQTVKRSESS